METRERVELNLRTASQFQVVLDAAPAVVWIAEDPQCRSIIGNQAAQELLRLSPGTEMSKSGPHPERLSHFNLVQNGRVLTPEEMPIQQSAATGKRFHEYKIEIHFDDGEVHFLVGNVEPVLDSSGRPSGAIGVFIDVTTRTRAEQALERQYAGQEALSRIVGDLLVENDPQAAVESLARRVMSVLDCQAFFNFLIDPARGKLHLNACAGIPAEEARRIQWLELGVAVCGCVAKEGHRIVAEDIQHSDSPLTALVKGYGIRAYACHPLLGAGGRVIGTLSFGTRTRDRFSPEDLGYMKTVTDHIAIAMEQRRAARELARLNEELEHRVIERTREATRLADQLRALAAEASQAEQKERRRLATILHDHIQQLLVAAHLQVDALKTKVGGNGAAASTQVLDDILSEALEASRNLTVELSPPILQQEGFLAAMRWLVRTMADKNRFSVELTSDPQAEPGKEEVRAFLFQCVRELLFNVLKHSGVMRARLSISKTTTDRIRISVEDEGKGFDPSRLKGPDKDSAAFGLFSIQQRVAHFGGEVDISSEPGKGTRIVMYAPLDSDEHKSDLKRAETPRTASSEKSACTHGKFRLMLVDDHEIMREGLSGILKLEDDFDVVGEADDGPRAIALADALIPEVIIMDINLGGMSGIEATRTILARHPEIKVIGLSMHAEGDVAQTMLNAGAVSYVCKGGPSSDLVNAIRATRASAPPEPELDFGQK